MSYLEKNLLPDEQIIYRTKKNLIVFLPPSLWIIGMLAVFFSPLPYVHLFAFAFAIAAFATGSSQLLNYLTSDFAVTTKRVVMKEGFFIRHVNETRLATVANISVNQSLLGQVLNYGTVILHTFGGDADRFTEIDNPNEFKNRLQEQLDKVAR